MSPLGVHLLSAALACTGVSTAAPPEPDPPVFTTDEPTPTPPRTEDEGPNRRLSPVDPGPRSMHCIDPAVQRQSYELGVRGREEERTNRETAMRTFHEAFERSRLPVFATNRAKLELELNRFDLALLSTYAAQRADRRFESRPQCSAYALGKIGRKGLAKLREEIERRLSEVRIDPGPPGSRAEICVAGRVLVPLPDPGGTTQRFVAAAPGLEGGAEPEGVRCVELTGPMTILFVPGPQCLDVRQWPDAETPSLATSSELPAKAGKTESQAQLPTVDIFVLETKFVERCEVLRLSEGAGAIRKSSECKPSGTQVRHTGARLHIDLAGEPIDQRVRSTGRRSRIKFSVLRVDGKKVRRQPRALSAVAVLPSSSACRRGDEDYSAVAVADPGAALKVRLRPTKGSTVRRTVKAITPAPEVRSSGPTTVRYVEYQGWTWQKPVIGAAAAVLVGLGLGIGLGIGLRDQKGEINFGN